jgi:hypothetical protein
MYDSLCQRACLIKVHHHGDGDTHPMDMPQGEFQQMLRQFQDVCGEPTFAYSQVGRQYDFEIQTHPNGKILFRS